MFGLGQLTGIGGVVVCGLILFTTTLLEWIGASFSEALYLSALGLVVLGYGMAEWRLRREE